MKKQTLILSVAVIMLGLYFMVTNNVASRNQIEFLNFLGGAGLVVIGMSVIVWQTLLADKKAVA